MRVAAGIAAAVVLVLAGVAGAAGGSGTIVFSADRAPTLAGDVLRIAPNGHATNLSRSPAHDGYPAVSPNGKLVAFSSGRGGKRAEYVIGVDGTGLRRVSPFLGASDLNSAPPFAAAWAPDGRTIAVLTGATIHLASPKGGLWRSLTKPADKAQRIVGWSKDGRLSYLAPDAGSVRVIDARGKVQLDVPGEDAWWSPSGRLAVKRRTDVIQVYDPRGKAVARVSGEGAAWSATDVLATVTTKGVLTLRAGGTAKPSLTVKIGRELPEIQWLGTKRLRYFGATGWVIVDARTGHTFLAAGAYSVFNSVVSADGTVAVGEKWDRAKRTLLRTRLGGSTSTVAATDACGFNGEAWEGLQLLPDGSVIYDTDSCFVSSDVWSVSGAGGAPSQLTHTPTDETQPSLSPDGARIAYSAKLTANRCDGCDETLWVMNADGSGARSFPNSADPNVNYDDSPSFSPDGQTILFARSGPNEAGLWTVPVAGGVAKPLGLKGLAPVWGPTRIAYENLVDGVALADPNGKNATALHRYGTPAFSPSGRLALLQRNASGALSILFVDTKAVIELPGLRGSYLGTGLAWSPDGARLAFDAVDAQGVGDVWTIRADGTGLQRITRNLGVSGALSWR